MKARARAEAARILGLFQAHGAQQVEAQTLQPADVLLDLYGEDIRARAYVTADPIRGELMLRPDFTVPVVRMHMESGAIPARYCYAGEVYRKHERDANGPSESLQVGYELFDTSDVTADAEVFAVIAAALSHVQAVPVMGDMGLVLAVIEGLDTLPARKAALRRHIWRPRRFRALLDRYCGDAPVPEARAALLAEEAPLADHPQVPGLRRRDEILARIDTLRADAAAPPIPRAQAQILTEIMGLRDTAPQVLEALRDMVVDMPSLAEAVDRFAARLDAFAARGIATQSLRFEASYLRSRMEYYDGFVFAFLRDQSVVATGGRYDALTEVLGGGTGIPAVGAVIRPEALGGAE